MTNIRLVKSCTGMGVAQSIEAPGGSIPCGRTLRRSLLGVNLHTKRNAVSTIHTIMANNPIRVMHLIVFAEAITDRREV